MFSSPTNSVPPEVLSYLQSLEPGYFPFELFQVITKMTVAPILELVPLRKNNGATEVLMLTRPANDPNWPGLFHTPGTYIRSTDTEFSLTSAFQRLMNEELQTELSTQPVFVQTLFHRVNRGMELALIHYLDLTNLSTLSVGTWFPATQLPSQSIETQLEFIKAAVAKFEDG